MFAIYSPKTNLFTVETQAPEHGIQLGDDFYAFSDPHRQLLSDATPIWTALPDGDAEFSIDVVLEGDELTLGDVAFTVYHRTRNLRRAHMRAHFRTEEIYSERYNRVMPVSEVTKTVYEYESNGVAIRRLTARSTNHTFTEICCGEVRIFVRFEFAFVNTPVLK